MSDIPITVRRDVDARAVDQLRRCAAGSLRPADRVACLPYVGLPFEAPTGVLDAVLAAHGDTIEILHRLTPIGVAMVAPDAFDPYKD